MDYLQNIALHIHDMLFKVFVVTGKVNYMIDILLFFYWMSVQPLREQTLVHANKVWVPQTFVPVKLDLTNQSGHKSEHNSCKLFLQYK